MIKNPPIIKQIVQEMGGTIEKIISERGCFYIKLKGEKIFVSRKFGISIDFFTGKSPTAYKDITYHILRENKIPTPKTVCFYKKNFDKKDFKKKLSLLKYPIVIKDANGSNSKGVFVNIETINEAAGIVEKKLNEFPYLIAQEMVFGKEYRVLILNNKAIGVLEMIPPRIFGDGENTVRELIERKQSKTRKRTEFNKELDIILANQGVELNSIPEKGKEIFIKKNSCLAEGGETSDSTELINSKIQLLCANAAKVTGKCLAGIDIICDDISRDPNEQGFTILEINGKPDLYIHYNPTHGKTKNVVKDIIEYIIKLKKVNLPI